MFVSAVNTAIRDARRFNDHTQYIASSDVISPIQLVSVIVPILLGLTFWCIVRAVSLNAVLC